MKVVGAIWFSHTSTVTAVRDTIKRLLFSINALKGHYPALPEQPPLAYSTVLTTLRILEDKGYLTHKKDGRAFLYVPKVPREQAQRSALRLLLSRFFENSAEQLVLNLLKHEKLDAAELRRLRRTIEEAE